MVYMFGCSGAIGHVVLLPHSLGAFGLYRNYLPSWKAIRHSVCVDRACDLPRTHRRIPLELKYCVQRYGALNEEGFDIFAEIVFETNFVMPMILN